MFDQSITKEDMRKVIRALGTKKTSHLVEILYDIVSVYDEDVFYTLPEMLTQGRADGFLTAVGMQPYEPFIRPLFETAALSKDVTDRKIVARLYREIVAPANGFQTLEDAFRGYPPPQQGYTLWRLRRIEEIKMGMK